MRRCYGHALVGLALALSLGGCGGKTVQDNASALASLDTRLTNNAVEPAPAPAPAAAPAVTKPVEADSRGAAVKAAHAAIVATDETAAARHAPDARGESGVRALASANGRRVGGCAGGDLRYGDRWATAMPDGLTLYPGARLVEAAGTNSGRCRLRVMSFTTTDTPQAVADHYSASAQAAGFDAERQPCRTEIRLGGTRAGDDAAYMLYAHRTPRGVTAVDIIASAGPA